MWPVVVVVRVVVVFVVAAVVVVVVALVLVLVVALLHVVAAAVASPVIIATIGDSKAAAQEPEIGKVPACLFSLFSPSLLYFLFRFSIWKISYSTNS